MNMKKGLAGGLLSLIPKRSVKDADDIVDELEGFDDEGAITIAVRRSYIVKTAPNT